MEIQKLDPLRDNFLTMVKKHNELVDAVNELQEFADVADKNLAKVMEEATRAENVQDKFAEQRKWIGKLCWFWNRNDKHCGILTTVFDNNKYGEDDQTEEYPFQRDSIGCWQHCEPVKPDDDIIYKWSENSNIKSIRHIDSYEYDKLQSENKVEPDCLYIIE